jgi:hypothetical protein
MAPRVGSRKPSSRKPSLSVVDGGAAPSAADTVAKGGDGRTLTPKDNQTPEDKQRAKDAAEQAQLLSYLSKLGEQGRTVAARKAELDAARAEMTETFRLAKAAGFDRQELNDLLKDIGTRSKDLVAKEIRRRKLRQMANLPTGEEQLGLFGGDSPSEVKDAAFWRAEGYQAYLRGEEASPPRDRMAARFDQDWLKGWNDGQTAVAMSMQMVKELEANGGGAHANANDPSAGADDSRPAGYKVERADTGEGFITIDAKDEAFGPVHATEEAAWRACRNDAETIARQNAAVEKARAAEAAQAAPPVAPDSDEV